MQVSLVAVSDNRDFAMHVEVSESVAIELGAVPRARVQKQSPTTTQTLWVPVLAQQ